ncbi:alpha-ketoglutarate-dependent dioxygenase alkB homolog 6-like isoform X2 [Prorops nasuta]
MRNINKTPQPKWTQLSHRRLQNWGGIPHPNGMIAEEIPDWLQKYVNKVIASKTYPKDIIPNHVLINEYLPGQGIMPHTDGPLFHPVVTTISCGSHTVLNLVKRLNNEQEHQQDIEFSFLLEPRSLLVLQKDLYHNYLHSIAERRSDILIKSVIKNINLCGQTYDEGQELQRTTRLSLTIRHVPKTSKLTLKIGK